MSRQVKDCKVFFDTAKPLSEELGAKKRPFHLSSPFVYDRQLFAVVIYAGVELGNRTAVFQTIDDDSAGVWACVVGNMGAWALAWVGFMRMRIV
jgi:hypothetical protein